MSETQLYLVAGVPTIAVLVGVLINAMQFNAHIGRLCTGMTALENRMAAFERRFDMLMLK